MGKTLSHFKWVDSLVIPRGKAPDIPNIVQVDHGVFKHVLRMGPGWHDGDRDKTTGRYAVKGRAEMSSLGGGTPMKQGETWLIGSTVMFADNFVPSKGYCHIAQPVLHQSYVTFDLKGDTMVGAFMAVDYGGKAGDAMRASHRKIRETSVKRGQWLSWVIKVKFGRDGYYGVSINGDDFRGIHINTEIGHTRGNQVARVSSFGGTWGLYMIMNGPPRDCVVYHANPFLKKIG